MARKRHTTEQIINHLREAEVELSRGKNIAEICRQLGICEQTYYRWRKEYGGLKMDQARRLKDLERENTQLKKLVADLSLPPLKSRPSFMELMELTSSVGLKSSTGFTVARSHSEKASPFMIATFSSPRRAAPSSRL